MRSVTFALLIGAIVALAGGVSAQSITTPPNFASNNGGSPGGCVYFDVTVLAGGGLIITDIDHNTGAAAGTAVTLDVYTVAGGTGGWPGGVQTNPAAWTQVSSGTGMATGINTASPCDVMDFVLPAGTHGIAIVNSGGHRYTNGNGANQMAATPEISISLGQGSNTPFPASGIFNPRVWNGTLHYAPNANILSLTQGPGLTDLTISLDMISAGAGEGWMLLSQATSGSVGQGPVLGIVPDATSWFCLGLPYAPGNPFHFNCQDAGVYPQVPLYVGPAGLASSSGLTFDAVCLILDTTGTAFEGASNVVRITLN